jgi:hypothetical protein
MPTVPGASPAPAQQAAAPTASAAVSQAVQPSPNQTYVGLLQNIKWQSPLHQINNAAIDKALRLSQNLRMSPTMQPGNPLLGRVS